MAYSDPNSIHNPATGTSPPASWGDNVRDNIVWLAGDGSSANPKPMCRVYRSTSQSIATATNSAITFDSERYDIGGMHSTVTNTSRITVPTGAGGVYGIGCNIVWAANSTGIRAVFIQLNGSTRIAEADSNAPSSGTLAMNVNCNYKLAAGDYVEVVVYQDSGGLLNASVQSAYSPEAWAYWIGVG